MITFWGKKSWEVSKKILEWLFWNLIFSNFLQTNFNDNFISQSNIVVAFILSIAQVNFCQDIKFPKIIPKLFESIFWICFWKTMVSNKALMLIFKEIQIILSLVNNVNFLWTLAMLSWLIVFNVVQNDWKKEH